MVSGWRAVAVACAAAALASVASRGSAGDVVAGREKAQYCSACHGMNGVSVRLDTPHLAGQSEIYLREQLRRYRSGDRVHPEMNIVARDLSDQDIEDLVAYFSHIRISVDVPTAR